MTRAQRPPRRAREPSPASESVLDFMRLLWAVDHGLHKASKRMARTVGVTGPQRLVIRVVGRFPGISAGQLASILHLHPSTLTGVLRRLHARGLLSRRADSRDGRRAVLGLTHKGRRRDGEAVGTIESIVRSVLARQPRARVRAAQELLRALAHGLGVPFK